MKIFAFIFARGGSKELPKKNIMKLNGKSLIQYSIDIALDIDSIDKIFVSTDSDEIIKDINKSKVEIIKRPAKLARDDSSEWLAWQHAVRYVEDKYGKFDIFVSLPCTSPLRKKIDVQKAIKKIFSSKKNDICISYTKSNRNPYFNMIQLDNKTKLIKIVNDEKKFIRRQDAPMIYDITTVVYATKPSYILNNNNLFSGNVVGIEIPKQRSVDIDDIYDFHVAKSILDMNEKK